jgi:hypothetical protein
MNSKSIKLISEEVYRRFPEVKGASPKIQRQSSGKQGMDQQNYVLIYQARVAISSEKSFDRIVRVVATENGKIVKMTTSR